MKIATILLGVLVIIGGVFALFSPGATFLSLAWLVGIMLLVAGVDSIAAYITHRKVGDVPIWELVSGILSILAGVLIISNTFTRALTTVMLVYAFATWITLTGILRIAAALEVKKIKGKWLLMMIFGIITIVLGIYSFIHPVFAAITLGYLIGFWVIMQGANLISLGFSLDTAEKPNKGNPEAA